jgi:hypothetical protein
MSNRARVMLSSQPPRRLVSARGIPDLLDTIKVKHVSGGTSVIGLKTYASGREKFQGETLDWV